MLAVNHVLTAWLGGFLGFGLIWLVSFPRQRSSRMGPDAAPIPKGLAWISGFPRTPTVDPGSGAGVRVESTGGMLRSGQGFQTCVPRRDPREILARLGEVMWVVDLNRQSLDRVVPDIAAGRLPPERYGLNFADLHPPLSPREARVAASRPKVWRQFPCLGNPPARGSRASRSLAPTPTAARRRSRRT